MHRPRTSTCRGECGECKNVEKVRKLIEDNNCLSCTQIGSLTGIDEDAVGLNRILIRDLHKKSVCCKWLPHSLAEENKMERIHCAQVMIETYYRRRSRVNVIVIDEKRVYLRNVCQKETMRAWVRRRCWRSTKSCQENHFRSQSPDNSCLQLFLVVVLS